MEKFNIIFWKEPYKADNSFLNGIESYITSAIIHKSIKGMTEVFLIHLQDIGLKSLFGDFEIIRQNGYWQTSDKDSAEFNLLKWNIINALELRHTILKEI